MKSIIALALILTAFQAQAQEAKAAPYCRLFTHGIEGQAFCDDGQSPPTVVRVNVYTSDSATEEWLENSALQVKFPKTAKLEEIFGQNIRFRLNSGVVEVVIAPPEARVVQTGALTGIIWGIIERAAAKRAARAAATGAAAEAEVATAGRYVSKDHTIFPRALPNGDQMRSIEAPKLGLPEIPK